MKLHLPLILRSAVLACIAAVSSAQAFEAKDKDNLGDTMFVGDSITHGTASKSYRWELHKIFVDNGISYTEVGVQYGNEPQRGDLNRNLIYGPTVWKNYHAAQFGEHAAEVAGRKQTTGRLGGTNIRQWLNFDSTGSYHIDASTTPSTYFMLLGTNDLLGNSPLKPGRDLATLQANLLGTKRSDGTWSGAEDDGKGSLDVIIDTMREKSGEDVDIVLLTVPTWYAKDKSDTDEADLAGVLKYNEALKEWAEWKGVTIVQSDKGIIDVAAPDEWKGQGVKSMFRDNDYLHPNAQGDLLIGGNVAKALGYAGRTAGQTRKAAEWFSLQSADVYEAATRSESVTPNDAGLTFERGALLSYTWETAPEKGFTVDFTLSGLGNGAEEGWVTDKHFSVSIGDGTRGGTLNINEAYIQWGDTILYSIDTSAGLDSLRVAYVYGNSAKGLAGGFYVWLDDQLIGEALSSLDGIDGLTITNGTGSDVTLSGLAMDAATWAPEASGYYKANPLIVPIVGFPDGKFPGRMTWCEDDRIKPEGLSMANNLSHTIQNAGFVGGTINTGSQGVASYINQGAFEGDMYITISGDASFTNYWGFHGYRQPNEGKNVAFEGNAYLRIRDLNAPRTYKTFMAVANTQNSSITGNMYFEVSSENVTLQAHDLNNIFPAITGIYNTNANAGILGEFRIVINSGNIQASIIGGSIYNNGYVNSVAIYINGGQFGSGAVGTNTVYGNIAAGGYFGSVGNRSITITGDEMNLTGCQYITAGSINASNKTYFAASAAAAPNATLKEGSTATVTIAKVTQAGGFGEWSGILSGGKNVSGTEKIGECALIFSGTTLEQLKATIENFDSITLSGESKVGLTSFGGATNVTVDKDSELTVLEDLTAGTLDNSGKVVVASEKTLTVTGVTETESDAPSGTYVLEDSSLSMGESTNGSYTVETSGDRSSLTLASDAKGEYDVQMAEGSTLRLSATDFAGSISLSMSGSGTVSKESTGKVAVCVDDSSAAGEGSFALNGVSVTQITLKNLTGGSQVTGLAGDGALTLGGKSSITLTTDMTEDKKALLQTTRALALADGAELRIDVNNILSEVEAKKGTPVAFYLSKGDLRALKGSENVIFDAALAVLNWKVEFGENGALLFSKNVGGIYDSSDRNDENDSWGMGASGNIYDAVGDYGAVRVESETNIDLSGVDVPGAYEEDGLTIKNLLGGNPKADLNITAQKEDNARVTITNTLSEEKREELGKILGAKIEDSLTYAGSITITNAELQIKHVDPDKENRGKADSTTIVEGNLTLVGDKGLTMTSGVLQLKGKTNDLGSGDVSFAGNDGQIIVTKGATLAVGGAIKAEDGDPVLDTEAREHIRVKEGGELVLGEGAAVGAGIVLGDTQEDRGGKLTVSGKNVSVDQQSQLSNVTLNLESALSITASPATQAVEYSAYSGARTTGQTAWELTGLTGSGALSGVEKDMTINAVDNNSVYSGDLSKYSGTMSVVGGTQTFSGVTGGSGWNLTAGRGASVELDLAGNGGSNSLTMGKLKLERGSNTSILLDLNTPAPDFGLHLNELEAKAGANITIGNSGDGLVTLGGAAGELVKLAVISVSGDDHDFEHVKEEIEFYLTGIKNAEDLVTYYAAGEKKLYIMTYVSDSTRYETYAVSGNSLAGARMLWAVKDSHLIGGDLAAVDEAVYSLLNADGRKVAGNIAKANKIMAAAAGASVAVMGQALNEDVERQLRSIRNRATLTGGSSGSGQVVEVWMNAEGSYRKNKADGLLPGYKYNGWGGTVGVSSGIDDESTVGLALTAMYGDLTSEGADRLKGDMDSFYLTAYAQLGSGVWRHTLLATAGTADMDVKRTVSYGTGSYTTHGSTDGAAVGLMYELGYSINMSEDWTTLLQPVINISFRHSRVGGYTERRTSTAALNVGAQEQNSAIIGAGARVQTVLDGSALNRYSVLEARALAKLRTGDRNSSAGVAFSHDSAAGGRVESAKIGKAGFELGAGVSVPVSDTCDIFADINAELWSGYTDVTGGVGFKITF